MVLHLLIYFDFWSVNHKTQIEMNKLILLLLATMLGTSSFAQCDAGFTYSQGQNNLQSYFVPNDTSQVGTYYWDFGDGTTTVTSSQDSSYVMHGYQSPGSYLVCATFDDGVGCTATFCDTVIVGGQQSSCSAYFTTYTAQNGLDLYFMAYDSSATGTYTWNFGDSTATTMPSEVVGNPNWYDATHSYAEGSYYVCLTYDDGNGCTDSYCEWVTVSAPAPCSVTFDAHSDSTGTNNLIDFIAYGTGGAAPYTYHWDYGDGSTGNFSWSQHTYAASGTYLVCVTMTDNLGCTSSYCDSVVVGSVNPPQPTCNAYFYWWQPQDSLNGTWSNEVWLVNMAAGNNLTYTWSFGDGTSATGPYPTHQYANVGSYIVCLSIDDGNGCTDTFCDTLEVFQRASGFTLNVIDESQVGAVGVEEINNVELNTLYPNPVENVATLELMVREHGGLNISIVDVTGKVVETSVEQITAGANQIQLNTSALESGMYFIVLSDEQSSTTVQFMKK